MKRMLCRASLLLVAVALVPACGKSHGGGGGAVVPSASGGGGRATAGPSGIAAGGKGGMVYLIADNEVRVGQGTAPAAPAAPAVPTTGTVLTSSDLESSDYSLLSGNILIQGTVLTPGTRKITASNGDIVVSGNLTATSFGALTLNAPQGSVYLTGTIRVSNHDNISGNGEPGGVVQIVARDLIFLTGRIDASGDDIREAGGSGDGDGGQVNLLTISGGILVLGGVIDVSGGDADIDDSSAGGTGGTILLSAAGALEVHSGAIDARGGGAAGGSNVYGGNGGSLTLAGAPVRINSTLDVTGGDATCRGADAQGGTGGAIELVSNPGGNEQICYGAVRFGGGSASSNGGNAIGGDGGWFRNSSFQPLILDLAAASWILTGGESDGVGGKGGIVLLQSVKGALDFLGTVDVSGGDGVIQGGDSGYSEFFWAEPSNCTVHAGSVLAAEGGTPGGPAGHVGILGSLADSGTAIVSVTATISARGGDGNSNRTAGIGGEVWIHAYNANITVAGAIDLRGGNDTSAAGKGGMGGGLAIRSDLANDDAAGNIVLAANVNLSGGQGTVQGGSARNDFTGDSVGSWGSLALEINADYDQDGTGQGSVTITGQIAANGAALNGNGGDILIWGNLAAPPSISRSGSGTGKTGDIQINNQTNP